MTPASSVPGAAVREGLAMASECVGSGGAGLTGSYTSRYVDNSAVNKANVIAGKPIHFTAADIHRVRHVGDQPAVTIHAYSPPLWRMGAYEILDGGELRRHSLSYAEELRPLS